MKINRWCWIWERIGKRKGKLFGYIYNPYLKSAQHCLELYNIIHNSNLILKDVFIVWEK